MTQAPYETFRYAFLSLNIVFMIACLLQLFRIWITKMHARNEQRTRTNVTSTGTTVANAERTGSGSACSCVCNGFVVRCMDAQLLVVFSLLISAIINAYSLILPQQLQGQSANLARFVLLNLGPGVLLTGISVMIRFFVKVQGLSVCVFVVNVSGF